MIWVFLALAGCGTNLRWLMVKDSRLVIEADRVVSTAETLATGIEQPVYEAEAVKIEACRFLYEAVLQRLERAPTFGEEFLSDLATFLVLLVPVPKAERCSDAFDAFRESVAALERQLVVLGVIPNGLDVAQNKN